MRPIIIQMTSRQQKPHLLPRLAGGRPAADQQRSWRTEDSEGLQPGAPCHPVIKVLGARCRGLSTEPVQIILSFGNIPFFGFALSFVRLRCPDWAVFLCVLQKQMGRFILVLSLRKL